MKNMLQRLWPVCPLFSFLIVLFIGCKKEDTKETSPETKKIILSVDIAQALPGDAVMIKSDKPISTAEVNITLNGATVKGYASGDTAYVFMVPVIGPGAVSLSIPALANSNTVNLTIKNYTRISDPQPIIDEYVAKRNRSIDSVTKVVDGSNFQPSPQSIVLLNQVNEEWNLQIAGLSASDKELLAYVLQRNMPDPSQYSFEELPAGYFAKPGDMKGDVGDKLVAIAKNYVTAELVCLSTIPFLLPTGIAFVAAPNPISALVFLGVFTTFIVSREVAIRRAEEVGRLKGVAEAVTETDALRTAEFFNNSEKSLSMSVGFRNLSTADANIHPDINTAFATEGTFVEKDKEVEAVYIKATAKTTKLKGDYPSYASIIGKKTQGSIALPIEGKNIIVKSVSDPRISFSSSLSGTTKKVKITSTATVEINFNLQVAYKRTLDGKEFTKDIACLYKPACDPATTPPPVVNGYSMGCSSLGNNIKIDVNFSAGGPGILVGSGSGSCDIVGNCYPVRLYFKLPGVFDWTIAANAYKAKLLTGTVNNGIVEISFNKECIEGKSAIESLKAYYNPKYEWAIELMNNCGVRSGLVQLPY